MTLFIFQVLAFFSARLEQHPDQTLSVGVVLDVIKQGTLQWPRDRLKVTSLCSLFQFYVLNFETVPEKTWEMAFPMFQGVHFP